MKWGREVHVQEPRLRMVVDGLIPEVSEFDVSLMPPAGSTAMPSSGWS